VPGPGAAEERPPSLTNLDAFPADQRDAARAVAASLGEGGERAAEFYATVTSEDAGKVLVFHLWHESAFEAQARARGFIPGNPGGKCRDVWYDLEKRRVTQTLYWQ
jgi:hypothetical protein